MNPFNNKIKNFPRWLKNSQNSNFSPFTIKSRKFDKTPLNNTIEVGKNNHNIVNDKLITSPSLM